MLLVLLTVLALMNADPVTLKVFGQHWQVPLPVALFGATVFGVLLTFLATLERYLGLRREIAALRGELAFRDAEPRSQSRAASAADFDPETARTMER
jgi:hypothetical protein